MSEKKVEVQYFDTLSVAQNEGFWFCTISWLFSIIILCRSGDLLETLYYGFPVGLVFSAYGLVVGFLSGITRGLVYNTITRRLFPLQAWTTDDRITKLCLGTSSLNEAVWSAIFLPIAVVVLVLLFKEPYTHTDWVNLLFLLVVATSYQFVIGALRGLLFAAIYNMVGVHILPIRVQKGTPC